MKSNETELIYSFLLIDLILLNVALLFVGWLSLDISLLDIRLISNYMLHGNLSWIIAYVSFSKRNLYLRDSYLNRVIRITKRHFVFLLVAVAIAFTVLPASFSKGFFFEYSVLFYIEKIVLYWLVYRYLKYKRNKNLNTTRAAVIGYNGMGQMIRQLVESNPGLGYSFVGYVSSKNKADESIIGHPDQLEELIARHDIHMVFYTFSFLNGDSESSAKQVLRICNSKGIRLLFIPKDQRWFSKRLKMKSFGGLVVINPQEIPLDNVSFRIQKRLFDITFSLFVIVFVFSWLFPIIALLIKIDSKGPVFFIQKRTGINNKTFCCFKFRSMKGSKTADTVQATANDKRITRLGSFLRKSNIDELPQFFNVLRGSMSVVGPRPHMLKHTEEYSELIDHYLIRHYVKPGITGWAQVKGFRGETKELSAMKNRVKADMEYIENWSFFWDMKIILLTVFGRKAYENAG